MRIYLDDNFTDRALGGALRKAGHTVVQPADHGLSGASDTRHLECAIREGLTLLTKDRVDFGDLHQLLKAARGAHHGIIVVRYENNTVRDMRTNHVVLALGKLESAGLPLASEWIVLNQWR